ncbi:MAG: sugar porter family MFS transporter [Bacteroidales bacterium]|nr:sugar porter family MFS transporter [Bacteroidales bacterium]
MKNSKVTLQAIFIALGGFLFGYDIAVISGTTSALEALFSLSKFELGFTVAIALIGTIIGTTIIGKPADTYGRRKVLQVMALIFALAALGSSMSMNWYMLLCFRFVQGLIVGGVSVVVPMYIAEISPAKMRGQLVALNQFNVVTAIFSAYLVNYLIAQSATENAWRIMIGVEIVPALLFFLLLFKVEPSPRWLIIKGKTQEAIAIFKKLGIEKPESEVNSIVESLQASESVSDAKLFSKENYFPVISTILIAMFNQLAGINAIIYYAPRIFEMTGLGQNSALLQSISIGGTNLLFTFVALFLIDRYGRRTLLMIGSVGMVVFLSLIARAFFLNSFDGYSVMLYLIGFVAFFAFSQGAVLWVFISEIFPNNVRAKGQALGSFTHWVMAAIVSWSFPIVTNMPSIGGGYSFAFFALMMLLHFFFAWKVIPETKGKSLEDIQTELAGRRK